MIIHRMVMIEYEAVIRNSHTEHKSMHTLTYCIVGNVHWSKSRFPFRRILIFEFSMCYWPQDLLWKMVGRHLLVWNSDTVPSSDWARLAHKTHMRLSTSSKIDVFKSLLVMACKKNRANLDLIKISHYNSSSKWRMQNMKQWKVTYSLSISECTHSHSSKWRKEKPDLRSWSYIEW